MLRFAPITTATRVVLITLLACIICSPVAHAAPLQSAGGSDDDAGRQDQQPDVDRAWLDRLDKLDRQLLDDNIGCAPPAFSDDLKWHGIEQPQWKQLRGRVIVVQSWTSGTTAGRKIPQQLERMFKDASGDDVLVIALHTPDNADNFETYIERRPIDMPVLVDHKGVFCDELGMYKRPTNVVIGRNGEVRYAGLKMAALPDAVEKLAAEKFDEAAEPSPRKSAQTGSSGATFPQFTDGVGSATDMRGKPAPEFHVDQWLNGTPDMRNKVVVIDFWATWCGPCVASIPHMNELAEQFRSDVVCVGLSDESKSAFDAGMRKLATRSLNLRSFQYALALDPAGKMKRSINVVGIPHVMVMSSDWVVRWQGHPTRLTQQVLSQIVEANKQVAGSNDTRRYRWSG